MNELEAYRKTLAVIGSCGDDSSRNLAGKTLAKFKPKPHPLEGLPVDTVLKSVMHNHHFARITCDGRIAVFEGRRSSNTTKGINYIDPESISITENDWVYWGGGECPLPGWVKIKTKIRAKNGTTRESNNAPAAHGWNWEHGFGEEIVGYKIIAQDIPKG